MSYESYNKSIQFYFITFKKKTGAAVAAELTQD